MALLQCAVSKGPKRLGTFALYQSAVSTIVKRSCLVHPVMLLTNAEYSWKDLELPLARFPPVTSSWKAVELQYSSNLG